MEIGGQGGGKSDHDHKEGKNAHGRCEVVYEQPCVRQSGQQIHNIERHTHILSIEDLYLTQMMSKSFFPRCILIKSSSRSSASLFLMKDCLRFVLKTA